MWPSSQISKKTGIQFPIIQAPMAGGATTPALIAAVSNAGGLGSLGAGYMTAQAIKESVKQIRQLTDLPFSVNLFVPEEHHANSNQMTQMCQWVQASCLELHMQINAVMAPYAPNFEEQMNVLLEENVPVVSFTFGIPNTVWINKLKKNGIFLIGTATNLLEAQLLEESGMDAVVAQGSESGGHRGTFIGKAENSLFERDVLIKELVNNLKIPLLAAGGIMNGQDIVSALTIGADAVQMGTAFLSCHESGIHPAYKKALLNTKTDSTTLTRAFSGKMARGIKNKFIDRMALYQDNVLDYPIQNALTSAMRKEAGIQNNTDFMSMWAGQFACLCKARPVSELMNTLVNEVTHLIEYPKN